MTVTGAVSTFCTFNGASAGRSRSFASFDRTNANRAGEPFALVGAHFSSSYSSRSVSSGTARGSHFEYERASRKIVSSALSSTLRSIRATSRACGLQLTGAGASALRGPVNRRPDQVCAPRAGRISGDVRRGLLGHAALQEAGDQTQHTPGDARGAG